MLELYDVAELTRPIEDIAPGSRGTVLILYPDACEIEFLEVAGARLTHSVPLDAVKLVWKNPQNA
jgi:hypothetical protein